jgi:excisionase family DNA binding protein
MSDESSSRIGAGDRELLTVEQAAHYLQLSPSSIRSYIRQGKLKAFRVAGLRKVLIPRAELLSLLEPTHSRDGQTLVPGSPTAPRRELPAG